MANQNKIKEGNVLVVEAEKHLKTGFLKWRPDYDSAAASFQKAAIAYKVGKDFEKARDTYVRLADAHYRCGARFHAAKAYEEAAYACKELKNLEKALCFYDHASDLYMENGTPDTAAMCLQRAGKVVELAHPEWAISSYLKAAEIWESEDQNRFRQAAELIGKVARLQVHCNKLFEAVKSIKHEQRLLAQSEGGDNGAGARLTCCLVLIHLHSGDAVTAEQAIFDACDDITNFDGSEEHDALHQLTEAFDERDQEKLDLVIHTPLFKYMDNVYAKLARSLRVPGYKASQKNTNKTAPPDNSTYVTTKQTANIMNTSLKEDITNMAPQPTNTFTEDEDIEEGELC